MDDFYKVYAYACYYKSLAERENGRDVKDITITYVCRSCPGKVFAHLREVRGYETHPGDEKYESVYF